MRATSERRIKLEHVAVWVNDSGVFLGATDHGCSFIVALRDTPKRKVLETLARFNQKTD